MTRASSNGCSLDISSAAAEYCDNDLGEVVAETRARVAAHNARAASDAPAPVAASQSLAPAPMSLMLAACALPALLTINWNAKW